MVGGKKGRCPLITHAPGVHIHPPPKKDERLTACFVRLWSTGQVGLEMKMEIITPLFSRKRLLSETTGNLIPCRLSQLMWTIKDT